MSEPVQANLGYHCTRLQCERGLGQKTAMRWVRPDLTWVDLSFQALEDESNRYANLLQNLGLQPGERVFIFLPKLPEIYYAVLGCLKSQAVPSVLFTSFGEEALLDRLADSGAKVVLTHSKLLRKINNIWGRLPELAFVIIQDLETHASERLLSLPQLLSGASDRYTIPLTSPETRSVLHYTSGSTGKPKGVQHVHGGLPYQQATFHHVLQVRPDDIFWCTADPAWVTGTTYGIIAPWSEGVTQIQFEGSFQPESWMSILEQHGVNVWYTAPTALRMMMRESDEFYRPYRCPDLRTILSVGEPLNPEIIQWGRRIFQKDIHDTWFQTETGAIMIANRPGLPIKPGSMGQPVPGIEVAVLGDGGTPLPINTQGDLCLKPGWASMFVTYLNAEEVYRNKFRGGYYHTGDLAYRDAEGYYWFIGRSDDVINTAGHLVSPFEVESALLEIPQIAESGVVGAPDPILFEKVIAYVCLRPGVEWSRSLEVKIKTHVANKVSSLAIPQDIMVVPSIPKNKSGKIMRRILRAWFTGSPVGDVSQVEEV